jgi:hypothetical protein
MINYEKRKNAQSGGIESKRPAAQSEDPENDQKRSRFGSHSGSRPQKEKRDSSQTGTQMVIRPFAPVAVDFV